MTHPREWKIVDLCPECEREILPSEMGYLELDFSLCPHCGAVYASGNQLTKAERQALLSQLDTLRSALAEATRTGAHGDHLAKLRRQLVQINKRLGTTKSHATSL